MNPFVAASAVVMPGDADREGVLDAVKAAVCTNINLFMEMNDEEFSKYLQTFVTDVWHLLMQVGMCVPLGAVWEQRFAV
jgi:exportin-2 (importin alpha re-exporter)